jgi:group I intron endonuclease
MFTRNTSMIIYQIKNIVNGKSYVGKTIKTAEERFKAHCYNHKNQKTHLYMSMRKHGTDKFEVQIIERVTGNLNDLNRREIYWISKIKPEYNMTAGGDGIDDPRLYPNFISAMKLYHEKKPRNEYATYGMLGKKQSRKFHDSIKKSNSCPVICEGVEYDSVASAQLAYPGIKVRYRLDNPKYPEFFRLKQKTARK